MSTTSSTGTHYDFAEDGISGRVIDHEDGVHGAFIPDGESYAIPVEWVRGDGPDRLATPSDWEQAWMSVPDALAASTDPEWWEQNGTLFNDLHPLPAYPEAADIILRPAYMAITTASIKRNWAPGIGYGSPALVIGEHVLSLDAEERDDEGHMLYAWAEYQRDDERKIWETLGDGSGREAEARAAVMTWAVARAGEIAGATQTNRNAAFSDLADMVRAATAAGMPEQRAAKIAGVDRMTVRRWLGKR